jgi:hypothetical protein
MIPTEVGASLPGAEHRDRVPTAERRGGRGGEAPRLGGIGGMTTEQKIIRAKGSNFADRFSRAVCAPAARPQCEASSLEFGALFASEHNFGPIH